MKKVHGGVENMIMVCRGMGIEQWGVRASQPKEKLGTGNREKMHGISTLLSKKDELLVPQHAFTGQK